MKVKVYNDSRLQHKEQFKGSIITIPPGGYVEMHRDDAVMFLGQFFPIKRGGNGVQLEESFKKLRIEAPQDVKVKEKEKFICHICGFEAESASGLQSHIRAKHPHAILNEEKG